MSEHQVQDGSVVLKIARTIRWLSIPIVLVWLLIAATTNVFVPPLEDVGKAHNVSLSSLRTRRHCRR